MTGQEPRARNRLAGKKEEDANCQSKRAHGKGGEGGIQSGGSMMVADVAQSGGDRNGRSRACGTWLRDVTHFNCCSVVLQLG
jgi:hypothetical protein